MGSRIREAPDKLFELFTEVARPNKTGDDAFVLQKYPIDFDDQEVIKAIPKFAFPCDFESSAVDHFTFVLTDIDSKFKFGFCRHATGSQTCLVVISCFPWYEIFYKLLNYTAEILNRSDTDNVVPLLDALYRQDVPTPGMLVEVVTPSLTDKFTFDTPVPNQLPCIPQSRNLTEYYNAVDANNMMIIFASMLHERRIIICSRKLSRLTACVHATTALLYPMHWQHLYIPVLPAHLIDYCSAPMPYVIGVHASLMEKARNHQELGDAIILDADSNTVTSPYQDLDTLPPNEVSNLRKRLRAQQSERTQSNLLGDGVSRAFLKTMVTLIGGYRDALRFRPGEQITFDPDAFVLSRSTIMHAFLEQMLQLQIFEQFINERLELLNSGQGFQDEFEMEANLWADKWGTKSRYREWLNDMKRQGKKIKTSSKDRWAEFTNRFRDKSKKAVKDIKSKFDKEEDDKPTAIPSSSLKSQRPPRPPPPPLTLSKTTSLGGFPTQKQSIIRRTSYREAVGSPRALTRRPSRRTAKLYPNQPVRGRHYKVLDLPELSPDGAKSPPAQRGSRRISSDDSEVGSMSMKRVSVDLMGDPDIQNVFKKSYSSEDITAIDAAHEVLVEEEEEEVEEADDALVSLGLNRAAYNNSACSTPHLTRPNKLPNTDPTGSPLNWNIKPKYTLEVDLSAVPATETQTTRPVPAPRLRRQSDPNTPDKPLINWESTESNSEDAHKSQGQGQSEVDGLVDMEFDPLKATMKTTQPVVRTASAQQENQPVYNTNSVHNHVQSPQQVTTNKQPSSEQQPVSKPRMQRHSVARNHAFYRDKRPESIVRHSPTPQAISEARTAFIQSQPKQLTDTSLHQFDPLVTGQLAMDTPKQERAVSTSPMHQEENLLKEWNLDFGKVKAATGPPAVPPKPSAQLQRRSIHVASPAHLSQMYPGHMGYSPGQSEQPANKYATLSSSTPSVHMQQYSAHSQQYYPQSPRSPHYAQHTMAPVSPYMQSQVAPAVAPSAQQTGGVGSGSQDPFTDMLTLSSTQVAPVSPRPSPGVRPPTPAARTSRPRTGWEQFE